jgi:rRNA maturation endonuclease Nob1
MEYIVLDANAIIKGSCIDFFKKAKQIITIEEVLNEIRDSNAREFLARLPYTIEVKEPNPEACKAGT